jgi:DNA-binding NtrC family response regulator
MKPRVLLVDDSGVIPPAFVMELREQFQVELTSMSRVENAQPCDVAILLDGVAECEQCHELRRLEGTPDVVLLSSRPNLRDAVKAIRNGASDLVSLSEGCGALLNAVENLVNARRLRSELATLESQLPVATSLAGTATLPATLTTTLPAEKLPGGAFTAAEFAPELVGASAEMSELRRRLARIAESEASVLITGETGTGKELAARALHAAGPRRNGRFVAVGCSAISHDLMEAEFFGHAKGAFTHADRERNGLFIQANGGTLFLDEMSDLPLDLQAKLLRVVQERRVRPLGQLHEVPFDARLIVATRRDLASEVAAGRFREDLYFRLKVIEVRMPPLRSSRSDLLLLAQHFIRRASRPERPLLGMTPAAALAILQHQWPGNVRELEHCIIAAAAVARYDRVREQDLPTHLRRRDSADTVAAQIQPLKNIEENHILQVLHAVDGNKALASKILGLDRKTLYRKLNSYATQTQHHELPSARLPMESAPG